MGRYEFGLWRQDSGQLNLFRRGVARVHHVNAISGVSSGEFGFGLGEIAAQLVEGSA